MQVFVPSAHPADRENNTVAVLRDDSGGSTGKRLESGLYIPGQSVEIANQGEVSAVSSNSSYQVGERVVFVKYAGAEIELNNVKYTLLKEKEIQGTVTQVGTPGKSPKEVEAELQAALAQFDKQVNNS